MKKEHTYYHSNKLNSTPFYQNFKYVGHQIVVVSKTSLLHVLHSSPILNRKAPNLKKQEFMEGIIPQSLPNVHMQNIDPITWFASDAGSERIPQLSLFSDVHHSSEDT